jgi:hypothetical protein
MEEELAARGFVFPAPEKATGRIRQDDPKRVYKVLICDHVGLRFGENGQPDHSTVKAHVIAQGGQFHELPCGDTTQLEPGIHFFYQPHLSKLDEIRSLTDQGQYDAVIAAATFLPKEARFEEGGVDLSHGVAATVRVDLHPL